MDLSFLRNYISDIKNGYYLKSNEEYIGLYYYHILKSRRKVSEIFLSLHENLVIDKEDISDVVNFINGNKDIYQEIKKYLMRHLKLFNIEDYQYLNGYEYFSENGTILSIDDNNIILKYVDDSYKDDLFKIYFLPKTTTDSSDDSLWVNTDIHNEEEIKTIYYFIINHSLDKDLFKYYYNQKKILNRKKVIDEIIN